MNPILEQISKIGLVPVIKLDEPEKAVNLAMALKKGGIPVAEVTFRAAGAEKAIANISKAMPDILVGAGTVVTIEQVKAAVAAGAKYIITPGFDREIVEYCVNNNIPITPGCTNPSEVSIATKLGLEVVKFFPAEAAGGIKVLKALAGPFSKMGFIPTGGISPKNLSEYVAFKKNIAIGGSWMVPGDLVKNNDWDGITALAKQAIIEMLSPAFYHIGINNKNEEEAKKVAEFFSIITGAEIKDGEKSICTGDDFESMKFMGVGTKGHIGIEVTSIERAIRYYEFLGLEFDNSSLLFDDNGKPKFVYFKDEIGGFAIHLVNKKQ